MSEELKVLTENELPIDELPEDKVTIREMFKNAGGRDAFIKTMAPELFGVKRDLVTDLVTKHHVADKNIIKDFIRLAKDKAIEFFGTLPQLKEKEKEAYEQLLSKFKQRSMDQNKNPDDKNPVEI